MTGNMWENEQILWNGQDHRRGLMAEVHSQE